MKKLVLLASILALAACNDPNARYPKKLQGQQYPTDQQPTDGESLALFYSDAGGRCEVVQVKDKTKPNPYRIVICSRGYDSIAVAVLPE